MSLEPNKEVASWTLRVGLVVTLLYSVVTKFIATEQVTGMFNTLLGFGTPGFTIGVGVVLILASIMLLTRWQDRLAAGFLTVFFAVSIISGWIAGGPMFSAGPAIWKDFGLLGASLALFYWE